VRLLVESEQREARGGDRRAEQRKAEQEFARASCGPPPDHAERQGKPEREGKWSIVHVLQHLADSEVVWAWRMRLILAQDRAPLTGYDQDLWRDRLRYRDVSMTDAFDQFVTLRRANLRLWQGLSPADLSRVGLHGERGEESLEHMRRLYAAHDLLHLRQLTRIFASLP